MVGSARDRLASSLTSRSLEPISTDNMSEDRNIPFFNSLQMEISQLIADLCYYRDAFISTF